MTTTSHTPMIQPPASESALSHIGFWECESGRILLAQDVTPAHNLMPDDVVVSGSGTVWRVVDGPQKRRGVDNTDIWQWQCDEALLAALDATQQDMVGQEGVG